MPGRNGTSNDALDYGSLEIFLAVSHLECVICVKEITIKGFGNQVMAKILQCFPHNEGLQFIEVVSGFCIYSDLAKILRVSYHPYLPNPNKLASIGISMSNYGSKIINTFSGIRTTFGCYKPRFVVRFATNFGLVKISLHVYTEKQCG